jgi:hypothetical protein
MYRLMVADLDSPSYFVAATAVDLGFFKGEGVETELVRDFGAKNGRKRCAKERCISSAGPLTRRRGRFRPGRAPSFCARFRNIPTGFWPCAPISTSSAGLVQEPEGYGLT